MWGAPVGPTIHTHTRSLDGTSAGIGGLVSLAVLAVGLGGLALDVPGAWVAFPVGYGVVLPLAVGWASRSSEDADADGEGRTDDDPLATLRSRYARGEIDEAEFEGRLERLLETEDRTTEGRRP